MNAIGNVFLYFAYGSNLLGQRIHINNPTAVRIGPGKLNEYRLDFDLQSHFWDGCVATIVPDETEHVWGAVWQLDVSDMKHLDEQEKGYLSFEANVLMADGNSTICRSYMLKNQPIKQIPLPSNRRPSKMYLKTIRLGANESDLPLDYIKFLNDISDNGREGPTLPWSSS